MTDSGNNPRPSTLLAYLRLFRLPNVFTAAADVAMGFLFVRPSLEPLPTFIFLVLASCLMYTAGMVLNDVYDLEVDRRERPFRPLPAGQISHRWAKWLGYEMLVVGVALGWCAGYLYPNASDVPWRSGVIATLLAALVVLYDAVLKKTPLGPVAMGGCRLFNVLLGMSVALIGNETGVRFLTFDVAEWTVAGGIGVYIVGVTWFARSEARESRRGQLVAAIVVITSGLVLLGLSQNWGLGVERLQVRRGMEFVWPLLLLLLSVTILRRCLTAVVNPQPQRVQAAVKNCILSLIVLDASVCLVAKPDQPYYAVGVIALLIPTLVLGKWVYST